MLHKSFFSTIFALALILLLVQDKFEQTMISNEEFEKIMEIGASLDDAAFLKFVEEHPKAYAEQERRNQTRYAIQINNVDLLRKIISESPHYVNVFDEPLLLIAAYSGNVEACKILIAAGADINQRSITNDSVLTNAKLSVPLIGYLLEQGADPNNWAIFHVFTVYQDITEETRLELVKLFVQHGLDINRAYLVFNDPNSLKTALDHLGDQHPEIAKYLIEKGAKHARELDNPGAYDSANEYLSPEDLEELRRQMAAAESSEEGK